MQPHIPDMGKTISYTRRLLSEKEIQEIMFPFVTILSCNIISDHKLKWSTNKIETREASYYKAMCKIQDWFLHCDWIITCREVWRGEYSWLFGTCNKFSDFSFFSLDFVTVKLENRLRSTNFQKCSILKLRQFVAFFFSKIVIVDRSIPRFSNCRKDIFYTV